MFDPESTDELVNPLYQEQDCFYWLTNVDHQGANSPCMNIVNAGLGVRTPELDRPPRSDPTSTEGRLATGIPDGIIGLIQAAKAKAGAIVLTRASSSCDSSPAKWNMDCPNGIARNRGSFEETCEET